MRTRPALDVEALERRSKQLLALARTLFVQRPHWDQFFDRVLGPDGLAGQLYRTAEEQEWLEASPAHAEIVGMLARLTRRRRRVSKPPASADAPASPNTPDAVSQRQDPPQDQVITVRIPKSMYDWLQEQASQRRTSLNKLCIAKLLQHIDPAMFKEPGRPTGD